MSIGKRGEPVHEISYAYATSVNADALGFLKTGCFVFETESKFIGVPTFDDAKKLAVEEKTNPTRWSLDHPANADLMRHFGIASVQPTTAKAD